LITHFQICCCCCCCLLGLGLGAATLILAASFADAIAVLTAGTVVTALVVRAFAV